MCPRALGRRLTWSGWCHPSLPAACTTWTCLAVPSATKGCSTCSVCHTSQRYVVRTAGCQQMFCGRVVWASLSSTLLVQERTERCSLSGLQNAESSGFLCLPGFAENCSAYAYTFTCSSSWHAWMCAACGCPPPLQVCLGVSSSIEREGHTLEGVQGLARVMAGRGKPALIVAHMLMDSEVSEGLTARSAGCSSPNVVAL